MDMEREPDTEYVASLSYGKDSMAMLEAIHKLGYPLDRIVTADVWATDDIEADLPEMVAFKQYADKMIKERYGIEVEHYCATNKDGSKKTYEQLFYHVPKRKKICENKILGFPMRKGNWCNSDLKRAALCKCNRPG
jgi:3'-phosphoadenosine 5'-phosphosulfate sulfotransferase (PAPS reductase)/FAD synthetase